MRHPLIYQSTLSLLLLFALSVLAQQASTNVSKRGIAYLGTQTPQDYNIFTAKSSPLKWYYNWSPYPVSNPSSFRNLEFVPLIANLDTIPDAISELPNLPSTSTHLLSFNEPDIGPSGGGSDISPSDAAAAYIQSIVPLSRANHGRFLISHPSTTGTLSGLNWLQQFNASCYTLNTTHGCHADFIATHFYGDFPALASWLGTLNEWYNTNVTTRANLPIWITELALPQQDATATERMINTTLPYLDALDYVARYAWFGIFRAENANQWTGSGVSLLNNNGGLSELGAIYLGGSAAGYYEGMSASSTKNANGSEGLSIRWELLLTYALMAILLQNMLC